MSVYIQRMVHRY